MSIGENPGALQKYEESDRSAGSGVEMRKPETLQAGPNLTDDTLIEYRARCASRAVDLSVAYRIPDQSDEVQVFFYVRAMLAWPSGKNRRIGAS